MPVDSFKYLPRSFRAEYEHVADPPRDDVFARPRAPIRAATVALLTTAGVYLAGEQEPFDLERERREPLWGDPSFRVIPRHVEQSRIGAAHLHINVRDLLADVNVALPLVVAADLEGAGAIGRLAPSHYSFMGYQERSLAGWRQDSGPDLVRRLGEEEVDALVLAPA